MFKWICEITSPRSSSFEDGRKDLSDQDDTMMASLVISQIEAYVTEFETQKEIRKSEENLQNKVPDYSWLISSGCDAKPKKHLTLSERTRLDRACDRVKPSEWSQIMSLYHDKLKNQTDRDTIIGNFIEIVHQTVISRPRHPPTINDAFNKYVRSNSALSKVSDSYDAVGSTRSMGSITFRDINDIV
ncbi:unnamed protein product [Auanema sp. JU1783]|nr:unnamed protein product [Auanema sp. JU1783]